MTAFVNTQHFLDLRFSLQHKVFWRPAAENEDRGLSFYLLPGSICLKAATLRCQHDCGSFIDVQ